jgi:hypothetical protein
VAWARAGRQEHFKASVLCYQEMLINATHHSDDQDPPAIPEGTVRAREMNYTARNTMAPFLE